MRDSIFYRIVRAAIVAAAVACVLACGTQRKARTLQQREVKASLSLGKEADIPAIEVRKARRDTFVVRDDKTGKDVLIMKAIKDDETGEMVANETLDAAYVSAKFRNLAERNGKVDLRFELTVPHEMLDSKWQLRFYPDMFMLGDSIRLDPVYITGHEYRAAQLKGYQQYEKFLASIITDSTRLIDMHQYEVFLQRNIPQVYAFKTDSTEVSDEQFQSVFGATQREALDHYTWMILKRRNDWKIRNKDKMFDKYVKSPIVDSGIRLDTVLRDINGDYVYHYIQTINTRPKLRRVDIVLSGDIWEQGKKVYDMPRSDSLTFYISSVSAFADMSERYLTRVIGRRVEANASYRIVFEQGKADIKPELPGNAEQITAVRENLMDLLRNEVFDLDSIVIVANASPEGTWALNDGLSKRRGEAAARYFTDYMAEYKREVAREGGFTVDSEGRTVSAAALIPDIRFTSRSVPENWELLDKLVRQDGRLSEAQKEKYFSHADIEDKDRREAAMRSDDYYKFVSDTLYPRLRVVDFAFHLHRKGMVQDTVSTTELDERYMEGIRLLKDMEYDEAVKILGPYQDYNAAVAYTAAMRNASAMLILSNMERTPQVNYLLAILYSRMGDEKNAVECYLNACSEEPSFVHRGNLDPEISSLIKLYGLNKFEDEDIYDY